MSFDAQGFLSPAIASFRTPVRQVAVYKQWFDFAEELNRLGLDMLRDHEVPRDDNQRVTIAALFVRAHQSFQAALVLAEMGMLADARVVLRSAVEGAIALNAVANDPGFIEQLTDAHRVNQRKTARLILNNPDYRSSCSSEEIAQMEATVQEVDAIEAATNKKLRDITWADVAVKNCKDLYELLYRLLSSDGTHTNINSIHRFLTFDPAGQLTGVKVGPDTSDMVTVLKAACLMFLWAADPFARAFNQDNIRDRIKADIQRFAELPQDEPGDVTVVANFAA
jgi:hypothetical protein